MAKSENVILAAVLVTTVTGKSGFGRTLQAGIIILKSTGVWYSIVFENVSAVVYVTDQTELKTVLIVTELKLNLYNGTPTAADVKELLTEPNRTQAVCVGFNCHL